MIETLKYRLLNGWTIMRFVRLVMAIFILVQAILVQQPLFAILGGLFLFQSTFNYGCAGGACAPNLPAKGKQNIEDIEYTEIK